VNGLTLEEIEALLMKRWEILERWLASRKKHSKQGALAWFSVIDLALSLDVPVQEASKMVQSYLRMQRKEESPTMFVLVRSGRTRAAVWGIGNRVDHAKARDGTLYEDVYTTVLRGYRPDIQRLAALNPQHADWFEQKLVMVVDGALKVLAASLDYPGGEA